MRKVALFLGTLALAFPAVIQSEQPNPDPEYVFEVGLSDDLSIHLLPRMFFALKNVSMRSCFDCGPDVEPVSFTLSLNQDDWTMKLDMR
jgi:hypothetical protein